MQSFRNPRQGSIRGFERALVLVPGGSRSILNPRQLRLLVDNSTLSPEMGVFSQCLIRYIVGRKPKSLDLDENVILRDRTHVHSSPNNDWLERVYQLRLGRWSRAAEGNIFKHLGPWILRRCVREVRDELVLHHCRHCHLSDLQPPGSGDVKTEVRAGY